MRCLQCFAYALTMGIVALATGCSEASDERPMCILSAKTETCAPLYPAEFPVIYRQLLSTTCASGGASCHGAMGQQGGLAFTSETESFDALLGLPAGKVRVVPGEPACSELVVRLDLAGHSWSMPPGAPLDERARCSIRQWIAAGAQKAPLTSP